MWIRDAGSLACGRADAQAKAMNSQYPFMPMYKANMVKDFVAPYIVHKGSVDAPDSKTPSKDTASNIGAGLPKLIIDVLNGGKDVGSKVKFSKFFLIIDVNPMDIARMIVVNEESK